MQDSEKKEIEVQRVQFELDPVKFLCEIRFPGNVWINPILVQICRNKIDSNFLLGQEKQNGSFLVP